MEKYDKLEKVGEGTYGKVYKARDKVTGQLVALKKTRLEMDEEGIPPTTLREISLLQMLSQSIYVVRLLRVEHVEKNGKRLLYLVFEYLDTDLKKYIDTYKRGPNPRPLPSRVTQSFLYQLCKGVDHCHSHGVLHRDLKPQNLLVDKDKGILKVADLGLGRAFTIPLKSYTHEIVTLWYRAPEVLLGATHYSIGVDMWSVGCIFVDKSSLIVISFLVSIYVFSGWHVYKRHPTYVDQSATTLMKPIFIIMILVIFAKTITEMARRQPLFAGDSELQQLLNIFRFLGTPNEDTWPGVSSLRDWHDYPQWKPQSMAHALPMLESDGIDLLSKMLEYNPSNRISAKDAMEHPYFDSLDKSQF